MKWSKLKRDFEARLAPALQGRVSVHVTEYTKAAADVGRGWIALDGDEVISIRIPSFYDNDLEYPTETMHFGEAVGAYLQMSIEEALESTDVLIGGFVILDKRFGKRRLESVDADDLHPFARNTFSLRCELEGNIRNYSG